MDEHVHEWGTRQKRHNIYGDVIEVWCPICGETMLWKDAKARLNATENLLSHPCHCGEAFTGRDMHAMDCPWYHLEWAFGKSKADILEGK